MYRAQDLPSKDLRIRTASLEILLSSIENKPKGLPEENKVSLLILNEESNPKTSPNSVLPSHPEIFHHPFLNLSSEDEVQDVIKARL